jgi:mannose-6-phosphate isomerase-like protein (cupin superfamily)
MDLLNTPWEWVSFKYPPVRKVWGVEYWLENNEKYCAKILHLYAGYECSLHYHTIKDETFIVVSGNVGLETYPNGVEHLPFVINLLETGDKFRIEPKTPHRFWSAEQTENAVILEISTSHSDSDVVRIEESRKYVR